MQNSIEIARIQQAVPEEAPPEAGFLAWSQLVWLLVIDDVAARAHIPARTHGMVLHKVEVRDIPKIGRVGFKKSCSIYISRSFSSISILYG